MNSIPATREKQEAGFTQPGISFLCHVCSGPSGLFSSQFSELHPFSPQASNPAREERAADGAAGPAAAARDGAQERAVREDLQRPHLPVQPHPDAG